jgi:hypothetical protein
VKSHAAVAAVLISEERALDGEQLMRHVLEDFENSELSIPEKELLRFVDKVNHRSHEITPADMHPLYAAGWTDEAIFYTITVCALFNFYNRWVDASGVHPLSDEAHRQGGRRSASIGYVRK